MCDLFKVESGSVAQSVEQWPFKPLVPGSSPGRPTTLFSVKFSKIGTTIQIVFPYPVEINQHIPFTLALNSQKATNDLHALKQNWQVGKGSGSGFR